MSGRSEPSDVPVGAAETFESGFVFGAPSKEAESSAGGTMEDAGAAEGTGFTVTGAGTGGFAATVLGAPLGSGGSVFCAAGREGADELALATTGRVVSAVAWGPGLIRSPGKQIGRASCRERVGSAGVGGSTKK